jgi:hypothetical protein
MRNFTWTLEMGGQEWKVFFGCRSDVVLVVEGAFLWQRSSAAPAFPLAHA